MELKEVAAKYEDYLIEHRRWFHAHPEYSEQEFESCKHIRAELDKMGVEWRPCGLETGTLATIHGAKPGKTILLRADMDALPVAEATGLPVQLFLSHEHGGIEQIGQRIIYNEIDMVLFFNSPQDNEMDKDVLYITRLCDQHSVPVATNVATAELLVHGLARGDLDWREGMNPNRIPFAL